MTSTGWEMTMCGGVFDGLPCRCPSKMTEGAMQCTGHAHFQTLHHGTIHVMCNCPCHDGAARKQEREAAEQLPIINLPSE